jgi:CheY-like chemotaxis protein
VIRESTRKAEALDIRFALAAQLAVKLGAELQMDTTPAATIVLFSAQFVPLAVGDAVCAGDLDTAPSIAAKPLRVLLAEDTADSQFLMKAYLKGQNCTVDIAADGAVAVRKVQERQYDIVFMDLDMPELDGVEATRRIREYEHSGNRPAMPIIALTAHTNDELVRLCVDAGFSAYMAKPVTKKAILGALSSYATRGRDIHLGNVVVAN